MPVGPRYRSRPGKVYTGRYEYVAVTPAGKNLQGQITAHQPPDECWDSVHAPPFYDKQGDLTLVQWDSKAARVSMPETMYAREIRRIDGVPLLPSSSAPTVWEAGWLALQTRAVLAVQDSDPIANVVVDIAEIADIPRKAQTVLGVLASSWLQYQWAIKPLLSNLKKMENLQQEVAARLARHRKKARVKRWKGSGEPVAVLVDEGSPSSNQAVNASEHVISDQYTSLYDNHAWWVAKLEIRDDFKVPEFLEEQVSIGFQSGITDVGAYLAALYEIIPWSFLIDYFTTLGSVIKYHTNRVVYDVPSVCLMATWKVRRTIIPRQWSSGGTANLSQFSRGWTIQHVKKRKVVHSPGVWVALEPLLTGTQIANLLALASLLGGLERKTRR